MSRAPFSKVEDPGAVAILINKYQQSAKRIPYYEQ